MSEELKVTNGYFRDELVLLKELAREFSLVNPALAPLLEGEMADPDVERLLEAVAFQNAMLRRKLDLDFPELINRLTHLILPHYLRPLPATTIAAFCQNAPGADRELIPAGAMLVSPPVDGAACRFATTRQVELHPVEVSEAVFFSRGSHGGSIRLSLALRGISLSAWRPETLRFFINDEHASACELYLLLNRHLERIILTPEKGGAALALPPSFLTPRGFDETDALPPSPPHAVPGYRLLQEYFHTPASFFFFELSGWEHWEPRGDGERFTIVFELGAHTAPVVSLRRDTFILNAACVVNRFSHPAHPVSPDHRSSRYPLRPAGTNPGHYQILSVDRVTGFCRETLSEREYHPFELFSPEDGEAPLYQALPETSREPGGMEVWLSLVFPGELPVAHGESLSIELTCSNGCLPESLHSGDIRLASGLPSTISGRNVTAVTPGLMPPPGPELLWRLASHLYLNCLPLSRVEHLRALLGLYVFPDLRSGSMQGANLKRIAGIESLEVVVVEERVEGILMRGREIRLGMKAEHFAGPGDLFLFGCVLDRFLAGYAALNCFTRLVMSDTARGGGFSWPVRLGNLLLC